MNEIKSNNNKPYFPLAGIARDGYTRDNKSTATCYCGSIQMEFPINKPGLLDSFLCNCFDCRKITASAFASNFIVNDNYLKFNRGENNLTIYSQFKTIKSGNTMSNHFCKTCGTLMFRISSKFKGSSKILRSGTIDDFNLIGKELKPRLEQYIECRVNYLSGAISGIKQVIGSAYKL